jgi:hypothetical protein
VFKAPKWPQLPQFCAEDIQASPEMSARRRNQVRNNLFNVGSGGRVLNPKSIARFI